MDVEHPGLEAMPWISSVGGIYVGQVVGLRGMLPDETVAMLRRVRMVGRVARVVGFRSNQWVILQAVRPRILEPKTILLKTMDVGRCLRVCA